MRFSKIIGVVIFTVGVSDIFQQGGLFHVVHGFPEPTKVTCQLTKVADHTQRLLDPVVTVMNTHPAETDDLVFVSDTNITDSNIEFGEMNVYFTFGSRTTPTTRYLIWADNGEFVDATRPKDCKKNNVIVYDQRQGNVAHLKLVNGESANVTVFGGSGFGQQVYYQNITVEFPYTTFHPTLNPTIRPSYAPSLRPSFAPTFLPTYVPTFKPTSTPFVVENNSVPTFENYEYFGEYSYENGTEYGYEYSYENGTEYGYEYSYENGTEYGYEYSNNSYEYSYEYGYEIRCDLASPSVELFYRSLTQAKQCTNVYRCGGLTKLYEAYYWNATSVKETPSYEFCTLSAVMSSVNSTCSADIFGLSEICDKPVNELTLSEIMIGFGKIWCDFSVKHCLTNFVDLITSLGSMEDACCNV